MTFRILPSRSFSKNRGFSLLEVLISIVVLSFGVLGAAGLQATSLQANREATHHFRTSAVHGSDDFDRNFGTHRRQSGYVHRTFQEQGLYHL